VRPVDSSRNLTTIHAEITDEEKEMPNMLDQATVRLSSPEWARIIRLGTERHIQELSGELRNAHQRIDELERKYGMSFARLQRIGLPDDAGLEAHEDYVEWSSLEGYVVELTEKMAGLQSVTAYAYAC
jgi:hypothetical protein